MSISSISSSEGNGSSAASVDSGSPLAAAAALSLIISCLCLLTSLLRLSSISCVCSFTTLASIKEIPYRRAVENDDVVRIANSNRNITIMLGLACWMTEFMAYESSQTS